jgi:putative MATE family efflux protein
MIISRDEAQHRKMTTEPVPGLIISLALPAVASMLVTALYNTADTFFVSRLGTSASGAVGIVFSLMAIIQAIGFTLGTGAGSMISRKLGAHDTGSASRYASTSFFSALLIGFLLTVFGLLFLEKFMVMLGSTQTILPFSCSYAKYILLGAPVMCASFVMNIALRSEGKAAYAMVGLVSGGLLNILLDPVFIFVLGMGISGAAVATLISQCLSFCILSFFFYSGKSLMDIRIKNISFNYREYIEILSLGCPSLCRQGLASAATVALNVSAAVYGDAAVAAMAIVGRIFMFILSLMIGLGHGFMPVAGYNYGAANYGRVKEAFWFTVKTGFAVMFSLAVLGFIFAPETIAIFLKEDGDVIAIGTFAMRLQCIALVFQPLFMPTNMMLQSAGYAAKATFLACNRQGIYFIPLILILPGIMGLEGVQIAQPLADLFSFLTCLPFLYLFMLGLNEKEKRQGAQ